MNTGLRINPVLFYGAPYTSMAAGAVWLPTKWLQVVTAVTDNDADGAATMTGFNTTFHGRDWCTVLQEFDFTLTPFDKTGHQRLGWFWTNRDFPELGGDGRIHRVEGQAADCADGEVVGGVADGVGEVDEDLSHPDGSLPETAKRARSASQ
jgi:hypothetical protein